MSPLKINVALGLALKSAAYSDPVTGIFSNRLSLKSPLNGKLYLLIPQRDDEFA